MDTKVVAHMDRGYVETPFDLSTNSSGPSSKSKLISKVCFEVMRMLKGKWLGDKHVSVANCTGVSSSLSSFIVSNSKRDKFVGDWILDTSASDYLTPFIHLLDNIQILNHLTKIKLRNGSIIFVSTIGDVLSPIITLKDVLLVPKFCLIY